ncbi:hypothetical protein OH784_10740 [Ectobacillus funiculus]|uniref:hypothetical protein n=1 Tax=Ectobacillus funiculus TaxID=137993 RepID=UPI00397E8259
MDVSIPRSTDLVLLTFEKNPLDSSSGFTITDARVIGSAQPCFGVIRPGGSLRQAVNCLIKYGFEVEYKGSSTSVSGCILLQRSDSTDDY